MIGFGHLGELLQFLSTVLLVALSFPLLTGLKPLLDDVDNFLVNFAERKKRLASRKGLACLIPRYTGQVSALLAAHLLVPPPLHFCFKHAQDVLLLALCDVGHTAELTVIVIVPVLGVLPLYKLCKEETHSTHGLALGVDCLKCSKLIQKQVVCRPA